MEGYNDLAWSMYQALDPAIDELLRRHGVTKFDHEMLKRGLSQIESVSVDSVCDAIAQCMLSEFPDRIPGVSRNVRETKRPNRWMMLEIVKNVLTFGEKFLKDLDETIRAQEATIAKFALEYAHRKANPGAPSEQSVEKARLVYPGMFEAGGIVSQQEERTERFKQAAKSFFDGHHDPDTPQQGGAKWPES